MNDVWKEDPPAGASHAWIGRHNGSPLGIHEEAFFSSFKAAGGLFGPRVPSAKELVLIEELIVAAQHHVRVRSTASFEALWLPLQRLENLRTTQVAELVSPRDEAPIKEQ